MAIPPNRNRTTAAAVEKNAMVARFVPKTRLKARRSPRAAAADIAGNAAIANDAPIRLTGTLWKLRAKLTELTEPGARVEARAVKYRKVSGSIGWLTILGTIRRRKAPTPAVRTFRLGAAGSWSG